MTLSSMWAGWCRFFFKKQSCKAISIYRLCFGLLILQISLVHINGHFLDWYGPQAISTLETVSEHFWLAEPRFDLLACFPQTNETMMIAYYALVIAAACLALGFKSQLSAFLVWCLLVSLHHQNPYNINGGDAFLRLNCFFLALAPCGANFSLDALLAKRAKCEEILAMPWAQRMIQIQIALVYWHTFCCKIVGHQWLDGTAVYYASRLDDMLRFPLPLMTDTMWILWLLNWFTLIIELFGFTLIWFKETRYWVVLGLLLLHLGIDYTINLPVFEWAFIITLMLFIDENDLKVWRKINLSALIKPQEVRKT